MAIAIDKANIGTGSDDAVSSTILTTTQTVASGGFIAIGVGWFGAQTLSSISGGGLTWAIDVQGLDAINGPGSLRGAIVSAQAPSGLASSTALTLTWSASTTNILFGGSSWTGVKTSSALDATAAALGVDTPQSTAWTSRSMTASAAGDLVIGLSNEGVVGGATSSTPTGPALELYDFQAFGFLTMTAAYRVESSAGSYTVAGTWANSVQSVTVGAAYLAAAASAAQVPMIHHPVFSGAVG